MKGDLSLCHRRAMTAILRLEEGSEEKLAGTLLCSLQPHNSEQCKFLFKFTRSMAILLNVPEGEYTKHI